MKNILVILFLLSGTILPAQTFEGILTWKISAEMDAATKEKMDAAQQKMNDPGTQAQMKEMKEKMNDVEIGKHGFSYCKINYGWPFNGKGKQWPDINDRYLLEKHSYNKVSKQVIYHEPVNFFKRVVSCVFKIIKQ